MNWRNTVSLPLEKACRAAWKFLQGKQWRREYPALVGVPKKWDAAEVNSNGMGRRGHCMGTKKL